MPHLPFHKFFGPGTDARTKQLPYDSDDAIAKQHDLDYENSAHSSDIRRADRLAISRFSDDFFRTSNLHSAFGAVALGAKYLGESITGVVYPTRDPDRKPTRRNLFGKGSAVMSEVGDDNPSPAKRSRRSDGGASSSKMESHHDPTNLGGAGSVDQPNSIEYHTSKYVFKHKHILQTRAWASQQFTYGGSNIWTTNLVQIPTDALCTYLTPAEYSSLPSNCTVKVVRCKVTPLGFRTPFLTGSAQLAYTNANALIFYNYGLGLNNKFGGTNVMIDTAAEKNSMIPGSCVRTSQGANGHILWGHRQDETQPLANYNVPTCFGNVRELRTVFAAHLAGTGAVKCLPMLMDDMRVGILSNDAANPPINYEYRPQVNMFKCVRPYSSVYDDKKSIRTALGLRNPTRYLYDMDAELNTSAITEDTSLNMLKPDVGVEYFSTIEMAGIVSHGMTEPSGTLQPPSFHVGVMPIHAFSNNEKDETAWQSLFAYWELTTEIEIESGFTLTHPQTPFSHPNQLAMVSQKSALLRSSLQPTEYVYGHKGLFAADVVVHKAEEDVNPVGNPSMAFTPTKGHLYDHDEMRRKRYEYSGSTVAPPNKPITEATKKP